MSWIGVDLDGILARYDKWLGVEHIGEPIPAMVERVKAWRAAGKCVKIFTARMHGHDAPDLDNPGANVDVLSPIQQWCRKHLGEVLPVTNVKDFGMVELWDDRCVQVRPNIGQPVTESSMPRLTRLDWWKSAVDFWQHCYCETGDTGTASILELMRRGLSLATEHKIEVDRNDPSYNRVPHIGVVERVNPDDVLRCGHNIPLNQRCSQCAEVMRTSAFLENPRRG